MGKHWVLISNPTFDFFEPPLICTYTPHCVEKVAKMLKNEKKEMINLSNFIQYILFPYDAACKCQGKDISVGLSKYSSSMKGSVLVHWVPGAGA